MKTFLKILAGLVVVIGLGVGAVFFATSDMVDMGDGFFDAVSDDDYATAWSYLSDDFKASTTEQELAEFLERSALSDVAETSWGSRSFSGSVGEMSGTVTTADGGVVHISLGMVKGADGWRIQRIEKPAAGIQETSPVAAVPAERDLIVLVRDTTGAFVQAVGERSMQSFHDQVSFVWQQQITVEKLDEIFGQAYDYQGDLTVLNTLVPQFDQQPAIDADGVLTIVGRYPTEPQVYTFQYKYVREGLGWNLLGFRYNIQ